MEPSRVLVTGGVGFLGAHLCRELLRQGHEVTCYDLLDGDLVNPATARELRAYPKFRFVKGDILRPRSLRRRMTGHAVVIHCAAVASVDRSLKLPHKAVEVNVIGTLNVLEAARESGVPRVHYVSTDEVWGEIAEGAFTESSPAHPRNPYAAGKAGGEAVALAWGTTFGIDVTVTNSCNTYGPFQKPDKLVPRSIVRAIRGQRLTVYGDGQHVREWVHVDDHVAAILLVLEKGTLGERYCVGTGERFTALEVVRMVGDHFGCPEDRIEYQYDRMVNDRRYALDATKLRELGWSPTYDFEKGLIQTLEWYEHNEKWWRHFGSR